MEIYETHRVTLLNAKCNYVCRAEELMKRSNYGEDVSCCIKDLWLASKLIDRLDCYCFPDADTTCHNCIEDSDLPKMYEVLSELLK